MWKRALLIGTSIVIPHMPITAYALDDDLQEFRVKLSNEWTQVRNDRLHNIKTYAKQEDGKRFRSFKVVMNTSLETITRVLLDFENYGRWYWEVREAKHAKTRPQTIIFIWCIVRLTVYLTVM